MEHVFGREYGGTGCEAQLKRPRSVVLRSWGYSTLDLRRQLGQRTTGKGTTTVFFILATYLGPPSLCYSLMNTSHKPRTTLTSLSATLARGCETKLSSSLSRCSQSSLHWAPSS